MKITAIRDKSVSIASPMRNAVIDFSDMTASVVAVETDCVRTGKPVVGYGFTSNGRYAQSGILRDRIIPRLMRADSNSLLVEDGSNVDPFRCWDVMMSNEKPGGHGERTVAVGAIDMALWDIVAKVEERPLYAVLADRYRGGVYDPSVKVYAAGGYYYPDSGDSRLKSEMQAYLDMGFIQTKMKVGGATLEEDLRRIESVLDVVGDGSRLSVDVNARFDTATAIRFAEAIEPYNLRWYEEPVGVLDYQAHADVKAVCKTPIATGENLFSCDDTLNLLRYAGLDPETDFLQMDPVLSYGLVEYLRTLDILREHGWSPRRCVPHGGHQFGLQLAAGLGLMGNEAYPGVFEPFGRFAPSMDIDAGSVTLPDEPGIAYEAVPEIYAILKTV